jgi:HK97 family phage major capsid protein
MSDGTVTLNKDDLEKALLKSQGDLMKANDEVEATIEKMQGEIDTAQTSSTESKNALEKLTIRADELAARCMELEQRGDGGDGGVDESVGAQVIKNADYQAMIERGTGIMRMDTKTAIINTYPASSVQPLVQGDRLAGIHAVPNRRLTIKDILPVGSTASNLVEFTRENAFTNAAAPQRNADSPTLTAIENVTKAESAITFSFLTMPVVTLAHFIPLSKQVLADSPQIESYVNGRLAYGLSLKEETQILKGATVGGEYTGIQTVATAYTQESPNLTNEIDIIRDAITQAQVAEYSPNFLVLNPSDWDSIQRRKVGSADDRYVYGDPNMSWLATPLWGLTPVITNSQTAGTFLIGDSNGCMVFDRQQSSIEIAYENGTDFVKNMATIRAELRGCVVVFRTESLITGSL